jgi:hypothetical protein
MTYRLFLVSKRNKIEKTERVLAAYSASEALDMATFSLDSWTVKGIEPCL